MEASQEFQLKHLSDLIVKSLYKVSLNKRKIIQPRRPRRKAAKEEHPGSIRRHQHCETQMDQIHRTVLGTLKAVHTLGYQIQPSARLQSILSVEKIDAVQRTIERLRNQNCPSNE